MEQSGDVTFRRVTFWVEYCSVEFFFLNTHAMKYFALPSFMNSLLFLVLSMCYSTELRLFDMGASAPILPWPPSTIYCYSFCLFQLFPCFSWFCLFIWGMWFFIFLFNFYFYIVTFLCCIVHLLMSSFWKKSLCVGSMVFLSVWSHWITEWLWL